jgi:hypothetical protein
MKQSVTVFGWSTIIFSSVLVVSQLSNLLISNSIGEINGLLAGYPGLKTGFLDTMTKMFEYNRIWSIYSVFYFFGTLIGGIQFVRLREIGRRILLMASWVGIINACIDTTMSYIFWKDMETTMSSIVGGMGMSLQQLNPLGLGAIIVGFFVWVIPSIGIIVYLRRPSLRTQMIQEPR